MSPWYKLFNSVFASYFVVVILYWCTLFMVWVWGRYFFISDFSGGAKELVTSNFLITGATTFLGFVVQRSRVLVALFASALITVITQFVTITNSL